MTIVSKAFQSSLRSEFTKFLLEIFLAWQRKNILEDRYLYKFIYVNVYRHDPHPCKLVHIPFIRRIILSNLYSNRVVSRSTLISDDKGEYSKNFRI